MSNPSPPVPSGLNKTNSNDDLSPTLAPTEPPVYNVSGIPTSSIQLFSSTFCVLGHFATSPYSIF